MSTAEVAGNNSMEQRSNQTTVIDLTEEDATRARQHTFTPSARTASHPHSGEGSSHVQRLPRFSRDVIDIDSDDEAEEHDTSQLPGRNYLAIPSRRVRPQFANLTTPAPPPSPPREMDDVEFLAERPRSRPRSRSRISSVVMTPPRHRSLTPYPRNAGATVDLTQDNEDEVMHVQTRPLEGINRELPAPADGLGAGYHFGHMGNIVGMLREGGAHIGGRLAQRLQIWPGMGAEIQAQHQALQPYAFEAQNRRPNFHPPANQFPRTHLPGAIDYDLAAFDLRTNNTREQTYSPPPKPSKGFTRSPTEDDIVVCPNCGDELAKGASELKQEVWVVKTCGHVSFLLPSDLQIFRPSGLELTSYRHTAATVLKAVIEARARRARAKRQHFHWTPLCHVRSRNAWYKIAARRLRGTRWYMSTLGARRSGEASDRERNEDNDALGCFGQRCTALLASVVSMFSRARCWSGSVS